MSEIVVAKAGLTQNTWVFDAKKAAYIRRAESRLCFKSTHLFKAPLSSDQPIEKIQIDFFALNTGDMFKWSSEKKKISLAYL